MARAILRLLAGLLILGALGLGWLAHDAREHLRRPLHLPEQGLTYVVAPGTSFARVTRELADQGVLERPWYLVWLARWEGRAGRIQAGEYRIPSGTDPRGLLSLLVSGSVVQHRLTIIEGWTFRQLMSSVESHPHLRHHLRDLGDAEIMGRLGAQGEHPEGRFLPETYRFPSGTEDIAFLRRAHRAMVAALAEEWRGRDPDLPLETADEALILASIIEKETARPDERAAVAGVFIQRLRRGMRLQTDPTVIYGLGEAFDGNLRRRDLRRDTPYNTYVHKGLPPTPIALPGRGALHAAVHPSETRALYFVARGDGTHAFSTTLAEHRRAVQKFQIKRSKKQIDK